MVCVCVCVCLCMLLPWLSNERRMEEAHRSYRMFGAIDKPLLH